MTSVKLNNKLKEKLNTMKAYYDRSDRDYYIYFENDEIERITEGQTIICDLYFFGDSAVDFLKRKLQVTSVTGTRELYKKNNESKYKIIDYQDPILLEHGSGNDIPYTLTLTASWMKEGLSEELLKRCGYNEQRYGAGCKIHFYANKGHFLSEQSFHGFTIIEARWKGAYG